MSTKPIATFKGDTFKNLVREYSFARMERDPKYKRAVYAAIDKRKAEQAAKARKKERVG